MESKDTKKWIVPYIKINIIKKSLKNEGINMETIEVRKLFQAF